MSFPLPDSILQSPHIALKQIMYLVKMRQNGDIAEQMNRMGLSYRLNYGVTMPVLFEIASKFRTDNALGYQLLNTNIREGMILASLLFNAEKLSTDDYIKISKQIKNIELIEQFSKNLYSKTPYLPAIIETLREEGDNDTILANYSFAWGVKRNVLNDDTIKELLAAFNKQITSTNMQVIRSISFALQMVVMRSPEFKKIAFAIVAEMKNSDFEYTKKTGEEFLWLNEAI